MSVNDGTAKIIDHVSNPGLPDGKTNKIGPNLTNLPAEVRHLILKELLQRSGPIFFQSPWFSALGSSESVPTDSISVSEFNEPGQERQLHPEILATCRQFHAEGTGILYNNTLGVRFMPFRASQYISNDNLGDPHDEQDVTLGEKPTFYMLTKFRCLPVVLGKRYARRMNSLPQSITTKCRKIEISVRESDLNLWNRYWGFLASRRLPQAVHLLAQMISQTQWRTIHLEVVGVFDSKLRTSTSSGRLVPGAEHSIWSRPLYPLLYLRDRNITCDGVEPTFAQRLVQEVASNSDVVDLWCRYDALKKTYESVAGNGGTYRTPTYRDKSGRLLDSLHRCEEARDEMNQEAVFAAEQQFWETFGAFLEPLGP